MQDIDTLMNPTEEGWKLLDEDTTASLYEKYTNTAKDLNAYLKEAGNSGDPEEKEIWNVCNAFRVFFASDMEVIRNAGTGITSLSDLPAVFYAPAAYSR